MPTILGIILGYIVLLFVFLVVIPRVLRRANQIEVGGEIGFMEPSPEDPRGPFWRHEMLQAILEEKPYIVRRSGGSLKELRTNLSDELRRRLIHLPPEFEALEDTLTFELPAGPHNGSYDGSVSISLHRKPVA